MKTTYAGFTESDEVIAERKQRIVSTVSLSPAKPLSGQKLVDYINMLMTVAELDGRLTVLEVAELDERITLLELAEAMDRGV